MFRKDIEDTKLLMRNFEEFKSSTEGKMGWVCGSDSGCIERGEIDDGGRVPNF